MLDYYLAKAYQEQRLREAAQDRLLRIAQASRKRRPVTIQSLDNLRAIFRKPAAKRSNPRTVALTKTR